MRKCRMHKVARSILLASCLILSCSLHTGEAKKDWPPNEKLSEPLAVIIIDGAEGVILPASHAPAALVQCSRSTLGPIDGYWKPTIEDLIPLEKQLAAFVRDNASPMYPTQWRELNKFRRQYIGVIRNGTKMIYVNLFPVNTTMVEWRRQAVVICDGGPWFFGVEYDIEAGKFAHIAYNGVV